jgi:hypothetical protein
MSTITWLLKKKIWAGDSRWAHLTGGWEEATVFQVMEKLFKTILCENINPINLPESTGRRRITHRNVSLTNKADRRLNLGACIVYAGFQNFFKGRHKEAN